jgi:hypothetical protein
MTCAGKVSSEVGAPPGRPSSALLPAESRIGCTGGGLAVDGGERKFGFRSPQHHHAHIPTTYIPIKILLIVCCSVLLLSSVLFSSQNKTKIGFFLISSRNTSRFMIFNKGRRRNYLQIPTLLDPLHLLTI